MSDAEPLSEYELARLQRIRDNHAQLVALGLAQADDDEDCVLLNCAASKKKKPKTSEGQAAKKDDDDDVVVPPLTRVLRSRLTSDHVQLSYEFSQLEEAEMAEEERAERRAKVLAKVPDRPGKRTSRPPRLYSQTQAEEIEAKQNRMLAAAAAQQQAQVAQAAAMRMQVPVSQGFTTTLPPVSLPAPPPPPSYERADRNSWFTQGQKAKCPHCHGIYVLKRSSGEMRTHTCVPFTIMDAAELLPSLE